MFALLCSCVFVCFYEGIFLHVPIYFVIFSAMDDQSISMQKLFADDALYKVVLYFICFLYDFQSCLILQLLLYHISLALFGE